MLTLSTFTFIELSATPDSELPLIILLFPSSNNFYMVHVHVALLSLISTVFLSKTECIFSSINLFFLFIANSVLIFSKSVFPPIILSIFTSHDNSFIGTIIYLFAVVVTRSQVTASIFKSQTSTLHQISSSSNLFNVLREEMLLYEQRNLHVFALSVISGRITFNNFC